MVSDRELLEIYFEAGEQVRREDGQPPLPTPTPEPMPAWANRAA